MEILRREGSTYILPKKLKVTFRIKKKSENGQSITLAANDKNHHICPVRAAYQIYLQAKCLGQSDDQPMGVFVNHQGIVRYLETFISINCLEYVTIIINYCAGITAISESDDIIDDPNPVFLCVTDNISDYVQPQVQNSFKIR